MDDGFGSDDGVTYRVSPGESVSEGVVMAVSALRGFEPVPDGTTATEALDPLYTVVDPEALDSLFETTGLGTGTPRGRVSFTYQGCAVTVDERGTIAAERVERPVEGT